MINNKIITVVLPAYNAEKTLEKTYSEIPFDVVDKVILVDDLSSDNTIGKARELGINKSTLHYLRKNTRNEKSFKVYHKIARKLL